MVLFLMKFEKHFWIVRTMVYFLKIMGLAPFLIQKNTSAKNFRGTFNKAGFTFSKFGQAYNIAISITVPVLLVFAFPDLVSASSEHKFSVNKVTDVAQGFVCNAVAWFVVIVWALRQRSAVRILNKLLEIDTKLSDIRRQSFYKSKNFISSILHCIINVFLWITVWITEYLQTLIKNVFINCFFFTVPSFIIYWLVVEYLYVVGVMAKEFEDLNKNLLNLKEFRYFSSTPFINGYLPVSSLSTHSHLAALQILRSIRTALFELSQDIADFFSFPILPCIAYSFFAFVYNLYYLVGPILLPDIPFSIATFFNITGWILVSMYPLTLLFLNIKEIVKQAKFTGLIVHKLLTSSRKQEITAELQQFSLRLLHEDLSFTAYGFFTLDFTLLHSMLGATATYLVILIQFQATAPNTVQQ